MPKVLRILNRFNIGGPILNAAYLSKYMSPEFETRLLGGAIEDTEEDALHILNDLGIDYHVIPNMKRSLNPLNDLKALRQIENHIKEFKPDIVHTHASKAGAIGRIAASRMGVKAIVHTFHGHVFHSYFSPWKTSIYKVIERYLARKTDAIIAISPIQKKELTEDHKIASTDKIKIIRLGFDLGKFSESTHSKRSLFREKYKLRDDTVAIGIVGRLVPIKNHSLFLTALAHLKSQNLSVQWKAFIIGDGISRKMIEEEALRKNLLFDNSNINLEDDLYFTSFIQEMDYVMAGIDIVVLSSKNEGTPVSLIEAQAASKPILTTLVGGVEDVVKSNTTALTASIDDPRDFCSKLQSLVEQPDLRKILGENGPNRVREQYHYTRLASDMKSLYTQLLGV